MIYGIILAAGETKRMGEVKLTLPLGDKKIIEWVLFAVKFAPLDKYYLVVRPQDEEIIETGKKWGAEIIVNPEYKTGMSSSIRKALTKISPENLEGFFIILADQPFIHSSLLYKMLRAFTPAQKEIIVPFYQEQSGNPVFFDGYWRDELLKVSGDVGGKGLIKANPEKIKRFKVTQEYTFLDVDWEKDYEEAKKVFAYLHKKGKM
ncbi:MAG: molybdenum cofactor cytidylyltransferase [Candidatus Caldatribacteriota bacterium]